MTDSIVSKSVSAIGSSVASEALDDSSRLVPALCLELDFPCLTSVAFPSENGSEPS
ncbi:unnamed protein product [Penicillium roqueforti FM164]|uniref:Genomic scaffold, ProqFM164S02 n=1 Tax=Penicillium roqueforti (strain FM164) TaxID=1365484 RepID=W6QM02_PENRF|nr:unnamed protein product [Penicillium roqueforti FM164]